MKTITRCLALLSITVPLFLEGCYPLSDDSAFSPVSNIVQLDPEQLGQASSAASSGADRVEQVKQEILGPLHDVLDEAARKRLDKPFLDWMEQQYGIGCLFTLRDRLSAGEWSRDGWHRLTGKSFHLLWDSYSGTGNETVRTVPDTQDGSLVIGMTGDVSLADNWKIMPAYDERNRGLAGILSERTIETLRAADILLVNSEFTFSERGKPIPGKMYTFRAHPSRVGIYHEMGVDLVSLANNHAFDYGKDAFYDTLSTLREADIPYMGGGKDLDEAMRPVYFSANGRKIAFVAATRAEKNILTPEAGKDTPGVLRTYDTEKFLKVIREAREKSDLVVAYVHWGYEGSHSLEKVQRSQGREFIDAGADIVVGAHAHVLQGVEFYKGKPLIYNLGNFIFNAKTMDTGILQIHMDKDGNLSYEFVPAIQKDCYTQIVQGEEQERILRFMEEISVNARFDGQGFITQKK